MLLGSWCWGAPRIAIGTPIAVEPEPAPVPAEAGGEAAAFDGTRWLVVYSNTKGQLAGTWLASDGSPIGTSFPLLGKTEEVGARLVFDGQSLVVSTLALHSELGQTQTHEIHRLGVDFTGPTISGVSAPPNGLFVAHDLTIDALGTVEALACVTDHHDVYCTISALAGDTLMPHTSFTLPPALKSVQFQPTQAGFAIFTASDEAIVAYHIDRGGVLSPPVPVALVGELDLIFCLTLARAEAAPTLAWSQFDGVHLARLDERLNVLATAMLPGPRCPGVRLLPRDQGYLLAMPPQAEGESHSLQRVDWNFEPAGPAVPLSLCENCVGGLELTPSGEKILVTYYGFSLRASLVDATSLEVEGPPSVDLSLEVVAQTQMHAAPSVESWLAAWVETRDFTGVLRFRRFNQNGDPVGDPTLFPDSASHDLHLETISGGPKGWLVVWTDRSAPQSSRAMLVKPDGAFTSPIALESPPAIARDDDGWLLVYAIDSRRTQVAERYDYEGAPLSRVEVARVSGRSSFGRTQLAKNEQGFFASWATTVPLGDSGQETYVWSQQLNARGEPQDIPLKLRLSTSVSSIRSPSNLVVAGETAWLTLGDAHSSWFSEMPPAEPLQMLDASFVELRAVSGYAIGAWRAERPATPFSSLGWAAPGENLVERDQAEMLVTSLSEPTGKRLVLSGEQESRRFGGSNPRAVFSFIEVTDDASDGGAGGEGPIGGASGSAGLGGFGGVHDSGGTAGVENPGSTGGRDESGEAGAGSSTSGGVTSIETGGRSSSVGGIAQGGTSHRGGATGAGGAGTGATSTDGGDSDQTVEGADLARGCSCNVAPRMSKWPSWAPLTLATLLLRRRRRGDAKR
ncbi:MAG TPA: hypothetical protein VG937_18955 [Polyangiaceae bacterium]|nr:hypothetical protein [Polyangiaceae bacterium]